MAAKTWVVIDAAKNIVESSLNLGTADLPGAPAGSRVQFLAHRSGLSQGVEELRIHNGRCEFSILPTRGMGLWKAWLGDLEIGWQSPVRGPVHPKYVNLQDDSGLGWLDGFDEWICRCGLASNGAPDFDEKDRLTYPLHGLIANRPAQQVDVTVDGDQIRIRGVVHESRFHFHKFRMTTTITTRFNQPGLEIRDEVTNLSSKADEIQMLYHCNFGAPLLDAGSEVVVPASLVVPRNAWAAEGIGHWSTFAAPTVGMEERVYFMEMHANSSHQTQALLKNGAGNRGASMHWDVRQLPYFSLWKNETALQDGYVTGLEPGTNFPNPRSFEGKQGRVVKLAGGASHTMQVGFTLHDTAAAVAKAEQEIETIRAGRPARVEPQPIARWCK